MTRYVGWVINWLLHSIFLSGDFLDIDLFFSFTSLNTDILPFYQPRYELIFSSNWFLVYLAATKSDWYLGEV